MQSQNSWLRLMAVAGLACVFLFAACESDADRIREINEADRTQAASSSPTATPTPLSAEIDLVDIQDGDCIDSTIEEGVTIESVVIVPCSGAWQYRVVNSFTVDNSNDYPGEDFFVRLAIERCDRRYTDFLYPLRESWESFWGLLAHREVDCLQQSFGLSAVDPQRLDRLVGLERLNAAECYNDAPETGGLLVELVDCSGDWEYRVLSSFTVADAPSYPGEDHFDLLASEQCDRRFAYFLYPTSETWALGDRTISCIQESFGLAASNPAKLDRLAGLYRLDTGECFNEAPETGGLMVELVDCSGNWEEQVVNIFSVSEDGRFPRDAYFQDQADQYCRTPWDYYYSPDSWSWELGEREVICVRTP